MNHHNGFERWFGRIVLLGVAANLVLALPALLHPNALLSFLGLPENLERPIWPSFAALLLLLLSAFYVPGALNPERYFASALLAVIARWAGFAFFVARPTEYALLGYFDLVFAVSQTALLGLALWAARRTAPLSIEEIHDVNAPA